MSPRGFRPPAPRRARPSFSPAAARRIASSHCSRVIRPRCTRRSDSLSVARVEVAWTIVSLRRYSPIDAPSEVKETNPLRLRTRGNSRMSAQLRAFSLPRNSATPSLCAAIRSLDDRTPGSGKESAAVIIVRPQPAGQPSPGETASRGSGLRAPYDLHAVVVVVQDVLVRLAAQRHAVRADLAEADPVPPSLAAEDERLDLAVRAERAIQCEQVLADAKGGANAEAADVERALAAADLDLHHPAAHSATRRLDVLQRAGVEALPDEVLELGPGVALLPPVGGGIAIVAHASLVRDDLEIVDGAVARRVVDDAIAENQGQARRRIGHVAERPEQGDLRPDRQRLHVLLHLQENPVAVPAAVGRLHLAQGTIVVENAIQRAQHEAARWIVVRPEGVVMERLQDPFQDQHGVGPLRLLRHLVTILESQEIRQVLLVQRQLQLLVPAQRADEISRQFVHLRRSRLEAVLGRGLPHQAERGGAPAL